MHSYVKIWFSTMPGLVLGGDGRNEVMLLRPIRAIYWKILKSCWRCAEVGLAWIVTKPWWLRKNKHPPPPPPKKKKKKTNKNIQVWVLVSLQLHHQSSRILVRTYFSLNMYADIRVFSYLYPWIVVSYLWSNIAQRMLTTLVFTPIFHRGTVIPHVNSATIKIYFISFK